VRFARASVLAAAPALLGITALGLVTWWPASGRASPGSTRSRVVQVSERDFQISAPQRVSGGDVTLVVRNHGPDTHELIVVRADGRPLPLRSDGLTVDERAVLARTPGSLDGGSPGSVRRLRLRLAPGRYVLLCNMAGHYLGGMHRILVVG
jgi:uncharacterized cupredoxin-like copper-binding protein